MAGARTHWWRAGALTIGLALAVSPLSGVNASTEDVTRAPLLGVGDADSIAGRYVVVLENGSSDQRIQDVAAAAAAAGGTVRFTYRSALKGFSAALPAAALEAVRTSAGVSYVEADARVTMTGVQPNPLS
ncbi:MAG: protease inhibitor I9 family protein [Actinomycetota bacterium]|nr:protease inhibitor I9 family protein [Actinomycetota bacterium]